MERREGESAWHYNDRVKEHRMRRDLFAGCALMGYIAAGSRSYDLAASWAVKAADAMMAALEAKPK